MLHGACKVMVNNIWSVLGGSPTITNRANDLVSPRDLLICLLISVMCIVAAVLLSASFGGKPLFWGLGASTIGFIACCFLVSPKREVTIVEELSIGTSEGADQ